MRNNENDFYDFTVNVQIKPHSNISPHITMGIFKWSLSRGLNICSTKYLDREI